MVDADTNGDIDLGVDGGIIPIVGRSSRFRAGCVGGSIPEFLIFESQLTAAAVWMVIDGRRLASRAIDAVIELGIRETRLRRMRKTDCIGRMVFFRFVNVERAIVFDRRLELRFGDPKSMSFNFSDRFCIPSRSCCCWRNWFSISPRTRDSLFRRS